MSKRQCIKMAGQIRAAFEQKQAFTVCLQGRDFAKVLGYLRSKGADPA